MNTSPAPAPTIHHPDNYPAWVPLENSASETRARIQQIHKEGTAPETIRAIRNDLNYFWAWAELAYGVTDRAYPVPVDVVEAFVVDHIKGLNLRIEHALICRGIKRKPGAHKFSTVRRRISSLSTAHEANGFTFENNPTHSFRVKKLLQNSHKSAIQNGEKTKKRAPITLTILGELLKTCEGGKLADKRDAAILLFGFSTGGRRRSEIASARCENLSSDSNDYLYLMPESKGDRGKKGIILPVCGIAAEYLTDWIVAAGVLAGPIFRQIDRHGNVGGALSDYSIDKIIKKRVGRAGYNPTQYGGHSLRAGFSTECGLQNISLENQMMLTTHKDVKTAIDYRRPGEVLNNPAARLADCLKK